MGSEREKINLLRYRQTAAEIRMAKTVPRHSKESVRDVLDVSYSLIGPMAKFHSYTMSNCSVLNFFVI